MSQEKPMELDFDNVMTRDELEVVIYTTDARGDYPVVGSVNFTGTWSVMKWKKNGIFNADGKESPYDLIPRSKRIQGWINIYPKRVTSVLYDNIDAAHNAASPIRLACIYIDIPEGEGLEVSDVKNKTPIDRGPQVLTGGPQGV